MSPRILYRIGFTITLTLLSMIAFFVAQTLSTIEATLVEGAPEPQPTELLAHFGTLLGVLG